MGFIKNYIKQCRKPSGMLGRFVGRTMNYGHSKIHKWGLSHIKINPQDNILDIGCGGGKVIQQLAKYTPNGKVFGIDFSNDMVQLSKKINKELIQKGLVEIKNGNVSSLPFKDSTFDIVTAFETYYFWPNLIDDLKEIWRVLKSTGTLLITNEVYKDKKFEKRNLKWTKLLDMKIHTPDEYHEFLIKSGYSSIEIDCIPEKNWITAVAKKK